MRIIIILCVLLVSCSGSRRTVTQTLYLNDSVQLVTEMPKRTLIKMVRQEERTARTSVRADKVVQSREIKKEIIQLRAESNTAQREIKKEITIEREKTKQKRVIPNTLKYIMGILLLILISIGMFKFKTKGIL